MSYALKVFIREGEAPFVVRITLKRSEAAVFVTTGPVTFVAIVVNKFFSFSLVEPRSRSHGKIDLAPGPSEFRGLQLGLGEQLERSYVFRSSHHIDQRENLQPLKGAEEFPKLPFSCDLDILQHDSASIMCRHKIGECANERQVLHLLKSHGIGGGGVILRRVQGEHLEVAREERVVDRLSQIKRAQHVD